MKIMTALSECVFKLLPLLCANQSIWVQFKNHNFLTCLHWMFLAGSFHLLHLMFDDYVLFLVENLYSQERSKDFLRHIKGEITGRTYSNNHIIHKCNLPLPFFPQFREDFATKQNWFDYIYAHYIHRKTV